MQWGIFLERILWGKFFSNLNQFIEGVDECQTDCQRAGKNSRAHREDTVFEVFLHDVRLLCQNFQVCAVSKDLFETVEKHQADHQRRAEKPRAE